VIKSKLSSKYFMLGCTALGGALTLPTYSMAASDDLEEVVVVGSRAAPRSAEDSPVPVDVFNAQDLMQSGSLSGEISQLLHNLVPSFNFPRQSNSDTADLVRPAQLRGLSPDHTLVLVNGKRRHTTAILNTGGKTGRGAAPVDLNTIPMAAIKRIEVLRDGAAAQYGSDAIAGVINIVLKDASEGGQVSMTYGQHKTDFDPTDENISDGETVLVSGNTGMSLADGFVNLSAQYRTRNATNRAGFDQVPFWENDAGNPSIVGNKNYRVGDPEEDGYSLFANWAMGLEGDMRLYGHASSSEREAIGSNFYRYPSDSYANVAEVYPNGYLPENVGTASDHSLVLGVKGGSDWQWDLSVNYGSSAFELGVENSINASIGAGSPQSFHIGDFDYDQLILNADAVKTFDLNGVSTALVVGAEYRRENYETSAGSEASYALGANSFAAPGSQGIQGLRPEDAVDQSRHNVSVFADAEFQLSERFLLGTAVRYEDYSDFGDTFNGKITARFELSDAIALRGAASTGFRAPSLIQNAYQATSTDFGEGGALATFALLPATSPLAQVLGAVALDAEESRNVSVGLVGSWDSGISLTLDVYRIEIDDRITLSEGIFTAADGTSVADLAEAAAHPGIGGAQFFTNAVDTRTTGFDLVALYDWNNFNFSLAYNKNETDLTNGGVGSVEEINTLETAAPDNKLILSANWAEGNWSAMARATQYGETMRVFDFGGGYEPEQTYGRDLSIDVDVEYAFSNGVTVAFGANNLLDEYPDPSSDDIAYFGNLPYDVIPPIGMNGRYVYARTTYNF